MRRVRSIRLKFLTKSHERKKKRKKEWEREGSDTRMLEEKSTSSHQNVENNADETSSRLARVIDYDDDNDDKEDEERKRKAKRKEEEIERGNESPII